MVSLKIWTTRTAAGLTAAISAAMLVGGPVLAQTDAAPMIAPAPAAPTGLSEGVAAVVNDSIISTYDFRQRVRLLLITSGVQPTRENMPQIEQEALRSLVDEHLEVQEIRREEKEQKFKILASDDDVNREVARLAQGNRMTGDQLLKALAGAGVGSTTLKDQLRAQISWERWIQGRYGGSRMKIGQDQISAVLRKLEAETAKPQYQIGEIFIDAARVGGQETAASGAAQLVAQLQQGAPFNAVARQFSAASTAANGGDAGWQSESSLQPEVREAIEQMRPGTLSKPIPVRDGVYIIYLRDKRAGSGAEMVTLKQAAIALPADAPAAQVEAARQSLIGLKATITDCATLDAVAAKVSGVVPGDLGEADVNELAPAFRDAINGLQVNQVSEPIRTEVGLHLIAVCGRRHSGPTLPPREEVEARLEDQQLSQISKRYLRDLRNSATIEVK
jgi:peptidyl-prolyl cis-trans isomerase SurA